MLTRRSGFSIIDLITTLAAILVLVALALPLLVRSKEHASKVKCSNNLRQIVIGAHNFHDAYKRLPPGTLGHGNAIKKEEWLDKDGEFFWKRAQNASSLAQLMPFIELNNIYSKVNPTMYNMYKYIDEFDVRYEWFGAIEGVDEVITTQVDLFNCPSDILAKIEFEDTIIAIQPLAEDRDSDDYGIQLASEVKDDWKLKKQIAATNYLGNAGAFSGGRHPGVERRPYVGPMSSRSRVRLETIRDGTSNTIMFGETLGEIDKGMGSRVRAQAWMTAGLARARGANDWDPEGKIDQGNMIGNLKSSSAFGFGSAHDEGAVFAFSDGSVRSFKRNISPNVFYKVCGSNDGGFEFDLEPFKSPIRDLKVRPVMRDYRQAMTEFKEEMLELEMRKAQIKKRLKVELKKVAEFQLKKKNNSEAERAYREILKIDMNDSDARAYFKRQGTLEDVIKKLKEQGHPKEPFVDVPEMKPRGYNNDKKMRMDTPKAYPKKMIEAEPEGRRPLKKSRRSQDVEKMERRVPKAETKKTEDRNNRVESKKNR